MSYSRPPNLLDGEKGRSSTFTITGSKKAQDQSSRPLIEDVTDDTNQNTMSDTPKSPASQTNPTKTVTAATTPNPIPAIPSSGLGIGIGGSNPPRAGFTFRVERSALFDRLQGFLPQMAQANIDLQKVSSYKEYHAI